jgi:hypothetical protein
MNFKKTHMIIALAAVFFAISLGSQAYAGGGIDPPADCNNILGPEIWGVIVMDCTQNVYTLRVKRIVDCNVQTFSSLDTESEYNCPATETDPINTAFPGQSFFPDISGYPIITKAKNLKIDGNSVSFDAQFKFCNP